MTKKYFKKYPWLSITTTLENYIEPDYYDKILKKYIFDGRDDLDYLQEFISRVPKDARIVEFGSGTGRATDVVLNSLNDIIKLTLVDQSDRMLSRCKERFIDKKFIKYINCDSMDFLFQTNEVYDAAYSLWSFSNSVHQTLKRYDFAEGGKKVRLAITKFITENIKPGGSFFLIHFDSLSQEQKISIRQRKKDNFVFIKNKTQSPSKQIIDELLNKCAMNGIIDFRVKHYQGSQLEFRTVEGALEYYLNFHMKSHFNNSELINEIIAELSNDIEKLKEDDGVIRIKPGCFIYQVIRK